MLRMLLIFVLVMVVSGLWMNYFDVMELPNSEVKTTRFMPKPVPNVSGYTIVSKEKITAEDLNKYKIFQASVEDVSNVKPKLVEKAFIVQEKQTVTIYVFTKDKKVLTSIVSKSPGSNFVLKDCKVSVSTSLNTKVSSKKNKVIVKIYIVEMNWVRQLLTKTTALVVAIIVTTLLFGLIIWSIIDFIKKLVELKNSRKRKTYILEPAYSFQKKEKRVRPKK